MSGERPAQPGDEFNIPFIAQDDGFLWGSLRVVRQHAMSDGTVIVKLIAIHKSRPMSAKVITFAVTRSGAMYALENKHTKKRPQIIAKVDKRKTRYRKGGS